MVNHSRLTTHNSQLTSEALTIVSCRLMLADGSHRMSRRRLPPLPPLLAVIVTLALVAWLALGDMQHFQDAPPEGEPAAEPTPPRVEVSERRAEAHSPQLVLQGHLTADRELTLRARQPGRVEALPVAEGERVEAGTVVLALARDELPRSEEHTSELQSRPHLVCRLLLEKKKRRHFSR